MRTLGYALEVSAAGPPVTTKPVGEALNLLAEIRPDPWDEAPEAHAW